MPDAAGDGLGGYTILVVEDEYFIATEMEDALRGAGAEVLGPFGTVSAALALIRSGAAMDGAVLDVNLGGEMVWPVADALLDRDVPLTFATGYAAEAIPTAYAHLPRHEKPVDIQVLTRAMTRRVRAVEG